MAPLLVGCNDGSASSSPTCRCSVKLQTKSGNDLEDGAELGVATGRERLVQAFSTKTGFPCNLRHAFGTRNAHVFISGAGWSHPPADEASRSGARRRNWTQKLCRKPISAPRDVPPPAIPAGPPGTVKAAAPSLEMCASVAYRAVRFEKL